MPDARLQRTRATLPPGYQFGDGQTCNTCGGPCAYVGVYAGSPLAVGAGQTSEQMSVTVSAFTPQDFINAAAKSTGPYRRDCGCWATAIKHGDRQYLACNQHVDQWIADRLGAFQKDPNLR